jgi:hypothetical protein
MSLRHQQEIAIQSDAANVVPGIMYRSGSSRLTVDVFAADANLFNILGGAGPNPAEFQALLIEAAGGIVAATNLGVGHYVVVGRPSWVMLTVGVDGGGPRAFGAIINFDVEE